MFGNFYFLLGIFHCFRWRPEIFFFKKTIKPSGHNDLNLPLDHRVLINLHEEVVLSRPASPVQSIRSTGSARSESGWTASFHFPGNLWRWNSTFCSTLAAEKSPNGRRQRRRRNYRRKSLTSGQRTRARCRTMTSGTTSWRTIQKIVRFRRSEILQMRNLTNDHGGDRLQGKRLYSSPVLPGGVLGTRSCVAKWLLKQSSYKIV